MEFEINSAGVVTKVALQGDLDSQTAGAVQDQLLPLINPQCRILLDMAGVPYISSVGLRALLLIYRKTAEVGGRIVLCRLSEMLHDTMQITGFLGFFEAYETLDAGLQALSGAE